MKEQHMRRAIVLRQFMIAGEFALPGEEVELTLGEYRELKYRKKIRDLTTNELEPATEKGEEEEQEEEQEGSPNKKDKK